MHINRDINDKVHKLGRLATLPCPGQLKTFILHMFLVPNVSSNECLQIEKEDSTGWKKDIIGYLRNETLLADRKKAKKIRTQTAWYIIIAGELYRRGFSSSLLKCLDKEQAN